VIYPPLRNLIEQEMLEDRRAANLDKQVSIRQHTSAYVSIRRHTSAYVGIRQHTYADSRTAARRTSTSRCPYLHFFTSTAAVQQVT